MKYAAVILTSFFSLTTLATANPKTNVIVERTIPVEVNLEELTLTCRMGLNGISIIALNSPTLERALKANAYLAATLRPSPHLTSPFTSASQSCHENNRDLIAYIAGEAGKKTTLTIDLSLVEATSSSFGLRRRVLSESFRLTLNPKLSFGNSSSILLHQENTAD